MRPNRHFSYFRVFACSCFLVLNAVLPRAHGQTTATPTFSLAEGTYNSAQALLIFDATPGANIYYTVDGSVPTPDSIPYEDPIIVFNSETVRAIATKAGLPNSAVCSAAYVISRPAPTWTDNDEIPLRISFIAGYEYEFLSSQASTQNGLVAAYGRRMFGTASRRSAGPYFSVRLLGAPQQTTTAGIVSIIANANSSITTASLSNVGSALDFDVGIDWKLGQTGSGQTTFEILVGGGATTPNQANTVTASYSVPTYGTVECAELIANLGATLSRGGLTRYGIVAGPGNNASGSVGVPVNNTACLLNNIGNSGTQLPQVADPTVTTLTYASPDHRSYFGKAYGGIQVMNRWPSADGKRCGQTDWKDPCERGSATFLVGEDANITGGLMRHLVLRTDVFHPLPLPGMASMVYVFGSLSLKLQGDTLPKLPYSPLILQTATSATASAGPSPNTLVLPFGQPDRDFYRIGVGISLNSLLSAVSKAGK